MERLLFFIKKIIPQRLFKSIQPAYHFLLAFFSAAFYGFPSNKLIVIGVTGTSGKTTSVYLISKMLESAGYKVGFTSTAMFKIGSEEWLNDKKMTMVGRFFTQKMLKKMVQADCRYAVIETTSQGIEQFRHRFINYDALIFTNLYPEHIEAHGGFINYKNAKGKLFSHLSRCRHKIIRGKKISKTIIVNNDDEHAAYFLNFPADKKITFSVSGIEFKNSKKIFPLDSFIEEDGKGSSFILEKISFFLSLPGKFNFYNALSAISVGLNEEISLSAIKDGLNKITGVPGRFEKIDEGQNFTVIIDYAFEPNAVSKLYEAAKKIPHKKIIHILGSTGGGRDISRRPILGEIAGKNSDIVIITNEDPYDDDPEEIINAVALGAENSGKKLQA